MKQFACGDVVPGCSAKWAAPSEDEILGHVAHHATHDHGMVDIPAELIEQVRARIVSVA